MRVLFLAASLGLVAATCLGCDASRARDKSGGETVVLHLATIDAVDNNGQSYGPAEFVAALEDVSDGRLQVDIDTDAYGDGTADEEARLVAAIAEGTIDGGWPSTRAFAGAGIDGLEVVEAPLTLTSYDALRELVTSATAKALLEPLPEAGIVGLALTVGPLRRPFAARAPLLEPDDWAGQRFRSFNSPVQDAAVRTLGGVPVRVGEAWPEKIRRGELRGVELDVAQYHRRGMTTQAGHLVSNVVLWPKVFVLSLSTKRWEALSAQQRAWVHTAAQRAANASVKAEYDEASLVRQLCAGGLRLYQASPEQIAALEDALQPVLQQLSGHAAWSAVRAIAARHPQPDELDLDSCRPAPQVRTTESIEVPAQRGDLPSGVYRIDVRPEDLDAAQIGPASDGFTGVWTLTVTPGRFAMDCTPLTDSTGIDCNYAEELGPAFDANPREVGGVYGLRGTPGTVWLQHEPRTEAQLTDCSLPASETGRGTCLPSIVHRIDWKLDGDQLTMDGMVSESPSYQLVIGPWTKIE